MTEDFSWVNKVSKQKLQHPDIFRNKTATSECIFTTNKAQSLDKPTEIVKDQLNPVTDSSTHSKINKFSEETLSTKRH